MIVPDGAKIYVACGYTDMRKQIDGLAQMVERTFHLDPFANAFFLFCGRRGQVPQLLFTFVESIKINSADTLGPINWDFIRTIAIIELYIPGHKVVGRRPGHPPCRRRNRHCDLAG